MKKGKNYKTGNFRKKKSNKEEILDFSKSLNNEKTEFEKQDEILERIAYNKLDILKKKRRIRL